mgnify:CR=1 FL=1
MPLQGHSAPLGLTFYEYVDPEQRPESCPPDVAFPPEMDGYAFIAYHGSWNRQIPTGYKVVYVEMDAQGNPINDQPVDLLMHEPPRATWDNGFRPVDVSFDDCGRLLVSSDGSRDINNYGGSKIVRLEYTGETQSSTDSPSSGGSTDITIPAKLTLTFAEGTGGELTAITLDRLMRQTAAFFDETLLDHPTFGTLLVEVRTDDASAEYDAANSPNTLLINYTAHIQLREPASTYIIVMALAGANWNNYLAEYVNGGMLNNVDQVAFHFTGQGKK